MNGKKRDIIILAATGIAFIILIGVWGAINIQYAPAFTLVLYAGLIVVTMFYAYYSMEIARATGQQANATKKMAEEMANTRYDAFRPIIDIVEMPMKATETFKHAFEAKEGKFPESLPCELHNIGVGPAIGVSSFIIVPSNGGQQTWDFGTIARGDRTSEFRLSPQQIGDRMFLVVYYKDVYGRDIESRREVTLDEEKHSWKIHPLETQVRKITKEGAQQ